MCFPHLFPSGRFGEFHTYDMKISSSEYAKPSLLNKDSRFRKDPQYVFFSAMAERIMVALCRGIQFDEKN